MANTMREIMNPCLPIGGPPNFPNAPEGWTEENTKALAKMEEIELIADHWETLRALQDYFSRNSRIHPRELSDALEEKFHAKGGLKYLYELFPGGPTVQGCRLAGIEVPQAALDPT